MQRRSSKGAFKRLRRSLTHIQDLAVTDVSRARDEKKAASIRDKEIESSRSFSRVGSGDLCSLIIIVLTRFELCSCFGIYAVYRVQKSIALDGAYIGAVTNLLTGEATITSNGAAVHEIFCKTIDRTSACSSWKWCCDFSILSISDSIDILARRSVHLV